MITRDSQTHTLLLPSHDMAGSDRSICAVCNKADPQVCARCGSIKYCSKECQVADWKTHKLLCAHLKEFSTAPVKGMRRAILFPADSAKPKFVWIATFWDPTFGQEICDVAYLLGDNNQAAGWHVMQQNDCRERFLQHGIHLVYRDAFKLDGSVLNQSLVVAANGKPCYGWRGPIVAVAKKGNAKNPPYYDDITLHDFRDVVDYLVSFDRSNSGTLIKRLIDAMAKGVRINCLGHMTAPSTTPFTAVEVHTYDGVFFQHRRDVPDISRLVGLPICVLRYPPDKAWSTDPAKCRNDPLMFLYLKVDGCWDSLWGSVPRVWMDEGGSALVVRLHAADLLPEHLEVLCDFCEHKIGRICADAIENGNLERGKKLVREQATKKSFLAYFETYRSKKAISDERWRSLISPYDASYPESKGPELRIVQVD